MSLKICLFGPTGSGKTTIAQCLVQKFDADLIKIAEPLYVLQDYFYKTVEKDVSGQDGELLQFLGYKIEKEQPQWLARKFLQKVHKSNKPLVVNDDCRFNSYSALKADSFVFIRIYTTSRTIVERTRSDHTPIDPNHLVEQGFESFQPDYTIDNNGLLQDALTEADAIIIGLLYG